MHYTSPYWLTFKQAHELGGHVRKGEKSCPMVFWKWLEVERDAEKQRVPFLRYYSVFNVAQCEGLKGTCRPPLALLASIPRFKRRSAS
jgi:antirestriction protein ArdC